MPIIASTDDEVALELVDSGERIAHWAAYSFNTHFLTPTDGFHFEVGLHDLTPAERKALAPGARVRLVVNGHVHATGSIYDVRYTHSRQGGRVLHVEGKDKLAPFVDGNIDPRMRFSAGQSLADVVTKIAGQFGWTADQIVWDNEANRRVLAGKRGTRTTAKGRVSKDVRIHQLQPYPGEGAFAFASRLTQRHGLWIWASADGEQLIISAPSFDQDPIFAIDASEEARAEGFSSQLHLSLTDQPAVILADGFSGGGSYGKSRIKAHIVNPLVGLDEDGFVLDGVSKLLLNHQESRQITITRPASALMRIPARTPVPMFLHDDESHTPDQLENFLRRELSLRMRKAVVYTCTVRGHSNSGAPWCVDAICSVNDAGVGPSGLHEPMYILSRTFRKSRTGGTTTDLEMILPGSLVF